MDRESKLQLKKGPWKPEEDLLLTRYIEAHGEGKWSTVSKRSGLMRGGKSCRLRWKNYLQPNLKHGEMSSEEEDIIIRMHKLLGNRWSLIAGRLPGRTDNEVKNYWNTHLRKKHAQQKAVGSKLKKRKLDHSADQSTCRKSPQKTNDESSEASVISHNKINRTEEGTDVRSNVTDSWMTDIKSSHYEIQQDQWLPIAGYMWEDPFLPSLIESNLWLESFGHNTYMRY